jgi:hypothetical protein
MSTREMAGKHTRCRFGVAARDVTAPVGIYMRWWGAATHDASEGVHRPTTATAAVIAPLNGGGPELTLVALDYCSFQEPADERALQTAIRARTGIAEANIVLALSHAHCTANAGSQNAGKPGADAGPAYLARLADEIVAGIEAARASLAPAWITYGTGHCALAANRDFWDDAAGRFACGTNPDAPADDTLLVARVTGDDGAVRAILFNYACHPTTLAWDNRLLSPDYVGAAREVLEAAFGAPALFLQGASGDLGPREGFVGDTAVADRNGRQLGYAVASTVEGLPQPGASYVYTGIVKSGADIGTWAWQPLAGAALDHAMHLEARVGGVTLPIRPYPPATELRDRLAATTERAEGERLHRMLVLRETLGDGETSTMPLWFWRLGDAILVAISNEPYSILQQALRGAFPGTPLLILGVTNGSLGYLCPRDLYGSGRYEEVQSPYRPGCLEATVDALRDGITAILAE